MQDPAHMQAKFYILPGLGQIWLDQKIFELFKFHINSCPVGKTEKPRSNHLKFFVFATLNLN